MFFCIYLIILVEIIVFSIYKFNENKDKWKNQWKLLIKKYFLSKIKKGKKPAIQNNMEEGVSVSS